MYPYPEMSDAETALEVVWDFKAHTPAELIQAEWILQGYAAKIGMPKFLPPAPAPSDPQQAIRAVLAPHFEASTGKLTSHAALGGGIGSGGWLGLLQQLLPIIGEVLKIVGTGAAAGS